MAELLTQHKIATTHQVRFLNTIVVRKSDFLTQTPDIWTLHIRSCILNS